MDPAEQRLDADRLLMVPREGRPGESATGCGARSAVDAHGAACGHVAGQRTSPRPPTSATLTKVSGSSALTHGARSRASASRAATPRRRARCRPRQTRGALPHDEPPDVAPAGAEREPDADVARPPRDEKRQHAVDPDASERPAPAPRTMRTATWSPRASRRLPRPSRACARTSLTATSRLSAATTRRTCRPAAPRRRRCRA